jgi:hypothetical protein
MLEILDLNDHKPFDFQSHYLLIRTLTALLEYTVLTKGSISAKKNIRINRNESVVSLEKQSRVSENSL